ncbi:MAG: helix-turn-helix domain-containing protein [Deltaproteobacteria bacterium]|nr:helix-turn-helix domain-containing protein [Deltaproteobacteria bacterium]
MFGKVIKSVSIPGYGGVFIFELPETIRIIEDGVEREVPTDELRRRFPGLLTIPSPYSGLCQPSGSMSHQSDSDSLVNHVGRKGGELPSEQKVPIDDRSLNGNSGVERTLGVREVAAILGCSPRTVHALCSSGRLTFHWVGKKRGFRPGDLEEYWERERVAQRKRTGPRKSVDDLDEDAVRSTSRTTLDEKKKGGQTSDSAPKAKASIEVSKASRLRQLRAEMRKW